jgi:hypothetical protein
VPHHAVFLFSTNKIFLTSAAGVHLCFHSQSRFNNPEHLKFLHVSSVHQKEGREGGRKEENWTPHIVYKAKNVKQARNWKNLSLM